jgi:predicted nuclease of restriction endonuclease-like (RecB) superfamily
MTKSVKKVPHEADALLLSHQIGELLSQARETSARVVNSILCTTYWHIGRMIVEKEQGGKRRADYGDALITELSKILTEQNGPGFSKRNLANFRSLYQQFPILQTASAQLPSNPILQTVSAKSPSGQKSQTPSAKSSPEFLLPWSAYVRLLAVKSAEAREFYHTEALRSGWSVRQLNRQIESQFYERTLLSKNKSAMLRKGEVSKPEDSITPEESIKDPYVLEFLGLKDEYSEGDLEEALIQHLETFLMELGDDFAFIGRQRRLRIDDEWYRVDLLFYHRTLRCLVVIDLKTGKLNHADAGQMHLYLNYAKEHWTKPGENPPVGLILCANKGDAMAKYALEGLPNKVLASEYLMKLPAEKALIAELQKTQRMVSSHKKSIDRG